MNILLRFGLVLGSIVIISGCSTPSDDVIVPSMPTGATIIVNQGTKYFEYQGMLYKQDWDGNYVVVGPSPFHGAVSGVTGGSDGKTVIH